MHFYSSSSVGEMGVFWWFPKIIWSNLRTSHFSPATRRSPPAELRDMRVASQTFNLNQFPSSNCSTHPLQKPCSMMTRRLDYAHKFIQKFIHPYIQLSSHQSSIQLSIHPFMDVYITIHQTAHPSSCLWIHQSKWSMARLAFRLEVLNTKFQN